MTPLLSYINGYVELTPDEIDFLTEHTTYRKYLKGQYVVQQGDVCRFESFVLSGCLKKFNIDFDGQEHVVLFATENWWAADLGSFLTQEVADCSVQCIENTEVIQFAYKEMELLYQKIPKLERFFRVITQNAFVASEKRIVRNFSLPAKERYIIFKKMHPQLVERVPRYLIASYLGITKEFLSKIRSEVIREK